MIKVLMYGAYGHMGAVVTELAEADSEVSVVCGVDAGAAAPRNYPVYQNIYDVKEEFDVVIDFSHISAIDNLLDYCAEKNKPVVVCTTGLSSEQINKVQETSKKTAVLRSANMSLGVNTLIALLKEAAGVFGPAGFDVEIVEKHHSRKLDAPSGTALALADAVNEGLPEKCEYVYGRADRREQRPKNEIGISAVRGGNIVGEHDVLFCGTDEVITFSHTAYSRAIFAKGAIEAAKFLSNASAGLYDMSDVISAKRS